MTKAAAIRPVIAPEAPTVVTQDGLPIIEPAIPPNALAAKISPNQPRPMIGSSRKPTSAMATQLPIKRRQEQTPDLPRPDGAVPAGRAQGDRGFLAERAARTEVESQTLLEREYQREADDQSERQQRDRG